MNTENTKLILRNLDPKNFESKRALYRHLAQAGVGSVNQLRSRYHRNAYGFRDVVDEFFNKADIEEMREELESVVYYSGLNNQEYDLQYRIDEYERTRRAHEYETQKYIFNTEQDWSVIMNMSDLHLDDEGTNVKLIFDTVDFFNSPNTVFASLGDIGNFWIHNWSAKLGLKSKLGPNDAIKLANLLAEKMGKRHRLAQVGNHDEWVIDSVGFDPFETMYKLHNPDILYKRFPSVVKFTNNTTESEWIKYNHYYKGGASMWNPHQSNVKHLLTKESNSVNFAITGHYHWPVASFAQFPFENRIVKSLLLGSPKSFDEYALSLGLKGNENLNPFGFIFLYNGITEVVTDLNVAKYKFTQLKNKKYNEELNLEEFYERNN